MSQYAYAIQIFDGLTSSTGDLQNGDVITSDAQQVNAMRPVGNFSCQLNVEGDGEVKIELLISLNGTDYINYGSLFEGKTEGEYLEPFSVPVCLYFKLRATETGGEEDAVVKCWVGLQ